MTDKPMKFIHELALKRGDTLSIGPYTLEESVLIMRKYMDAEGEDNFIFRWIETGAEIPDPGTVHAAGVLIIKHREISHVIMAEPVGTAYNEKHGAGL